MAKTNSNNEMKIFHMNSGMFQYFLFFDSPKKIIFHTPSIALKLHIRGMKTKFTGNPKIQSNVWQFRQEQFRSTIKTIEENTCSNSRKRVKFNDNPVIRRMYVWQFAHKQARKGDWENTYSDKLHFQSRIDKVNKVISPILESKLEKINKYSPKLSNISPKRNTCLKYYENYK